MAGNNTNIVYVQAIEGLAVQIGENLGKLQEGNTQQHEAKYEAIEYLANYERVQIKALRDAFE